MERKAVLMLLTTLAILATLLAKAFLNFDWASTIFTILIIILAYCVLDFFL